MYAIKRRSTLYFGRDSTLQESMFIWQTLIDRGLVLACIIHPERISIENKTLVLFWVADTLFGIPSGYVQCIQHLGSYVPLPFAHPCVAGVITFQERLLTVLDVRPLMGKQHIAPSSDAPTIIVRLESMDIALLTDRVITAPSTHIAIDMYRFATR